MTKLDRIGNLIIGILTVLLGAVLFKVEAEPALLIMGVIFLVSLSESCLRSLIYYARLARHMVGGRRELYRGVLYADLAILLGALINASLVYVIIYIAILQGFSGIVEVLRAREAKSVGAGSWKFTIAQGIANILLVAAMIVTAMVFDDMRLSVYVYAAGLIYTGALRAANTFKRTEIVYIQ